MKVTTKVALLVPAMLLVLGASAHAQPFGRRAVFVPRAYFYAPFYDPFWPYGYGYGYGQGSQSLAAAQGQPPQLTGTEGRL